MFTTSINTPTKRWIAVLTASFVIVAGIVGAITLKRANTYEFSLRQKVSASSALRITFPEPMDRHSVGEHLVLPTQIRGDIAWEDNSSFVLKPTENLEADSQFQIRVEAGVLRTDGTPLRDDLVFTFLVTGAPVVSASVPTGSSSMVPVHSEIAIVFDRPIARLTDLDNQSHFKKWPVTISPSVKGSWKWLGTTTATFVPSSKLTKATKYTVTVPAGIVTASGEATEQMFQWHFETQRPRLLSSSPEKGSRFAGPTTVVTLTFDTDMDIVKARDFISLSETSDKKSEKLVPIKKISYGSEKVDGAIKLNKKILLVTPESSLRSNSEYMVKISSGTPSLEGNLGTTETENIDFATVKNFQVDSGRYLKQGGMMEIAFSSPVDEKQVRKHLQFVPPIKEEDITVYTSQSSSMGALSVNVYPTLNPSTKYTLSFSKGFTDVYNQKLAKEWSMKFDTPALHPDVFVYPRQGEFGVMEKSLPKEVFINALNIKTVQLELGKIPLSKFLAMRNYFVLNWQKESIAKYVDVLQTHTIDTSSKLNTWKSATVELQKYIGEKESGMYALSVTSPEWKTREGALQKDVRIISVSDIGITLKYSGQKVLVWVTNMQTGDPVKNARISFHTIEGKVPLSGTTNAQGLFESNFSISDFSYPNNEYQPEFWVTAETKDDFAIVGSHWNSGIEPYTFAGGIYTDFRSPQSRPIRLQHYLYTDRPLYGAGDTVHFKGIIRSLDWNGTLSIPSSSSRSIALTIQDAEGKEVYAKTLKLSSFGSFSGEMQLSESASLGQYSMRAKVVPDTDVNSEIWSQFSVLAYRKPEYKIEMSSSKQDYASGEAATVNLSGQYYFGAPMPNAKVRWRVHSIDYFFNKHEGEWYVFGDSSSWCWYECYREESQVLTGEATLDATGRLSIEVPTDLSTKKTSQVYSIEADITDSNNQVVSGRTDFVVHKSNVYVGVRSDDYAVPEGEQMTFTLLTLDPNGKPKPNVAVDVSVYKRVWNVVKQKGVDGEYYYDNKSEDTLITTKSGRSSADGKAQQSFTLDKGGEYVAIASVQDEAGRPSKASYSFYVWSDMFFNWPRSNTSKIDIILDKPKYAVGDIAKVLVKSPYQGKGVKALLTVERENVMTKKVIDVQSNAEVYEVPITEDMLPTAYVSVVLVKPRIGETFDDQGVDTGSPSFRIGYAKLLIDTKPKTLSVKIKTNKEKYLPGEEVSATIEATDSAGNPAKAEFSLSVVDLSLIDLTGFTVPDIVSSFYYERGLGVLSSSTLTFLLERFKPGSKGGGGGGEDRKRGNFLDTAYWNPSLITDVNGQASVKFTLPDNLTTWQLLALGSTKDNKFGGVAKTIIETKKTIVRPIRPRFAVNGDKAILGAIVHNYLPEDHVFTVELTGSGFTHTGKSVQEVRVPKDGSVTLDFPVRFGSDKSATLLFAARTKGAKDEIQETIPVYAFGVQQTVATSGVTTDIAEEKLRIPTKKDAQHGEVTVSLSPSIAVYLPSSLEYLSTFPYGCAEQTMSALVPNIALMQLQKYDSFSFVADQELQKHVTVGLQKLYSLQMADGGFGYFPGSQKSYAYLSAYILHGLTIAESAGYPVDRNAISNVVLYLRNRRNVSDVTVDVDQRAYIAYVLGLQSVSEATELNSLYATRDALQLHSKAHLAMALKKSGDSSQAKRLLNDVLSRVRVDSRGAHFEEESRGSYETMNTDMRTTAIVLQALLSIDPSNVLTEKIVRGMLASRHEGRWDTTQSTAQAVLAFVKYLEVTNELSFDFDGSVEINGVNLLSKKFQSPKLSTFEVEKSIDDFVRGADVTMKLAKQGEGRMYYDTTLSYFHTPDVIEPREEGIGILREMKPLSKKDSNVAVGSVQKVTLTITVPESRHFVAVESMLAAGFEPIDLGYATSQKNLLSSEVTNGSDDWTDYFKNQVWRFTHIEFRDDRVFLFAEELPAGVYKYEYLVRATTPGTYRERPAKVWEMYFPETFGQTSGGWVTIAE